MTESMRMWIEIIFNLAYLAAIWVLVVAMVRRLGALTPAGRRLGRLFVLAFGLLALGDTGHVGFRVLAYALGGLETPAHLFGVNVGLVGLGALSTAVTVTFFYVVILMIWRERFGKPYGWLGGLLLLAAAARLIVMCLPGNQWSSSVPPQPMSIYRNLPLVVQGLGAAYLILRDAGRARDRTFTGVGIMILISYAFYIPVILFVQRAPMIGMLMIPKTLAYVGIALLAYFGLFRRAGPET